MLTIPGRIPIRIYPLFGVVVLILSLYQGNFQLYGALLWTIVICFSLLVHEYGHALTAIACGQRASIDLVGFGGVTHRHGPHLSHLKEFMIVLNGPLAGFSLFALSYFLLVTFGASLSQSLRDILFISTYANFYWTILNLIPVQPLDGGHLLRIILEGAFGLRGLKAAFFLSFLTGFFLSLFFLMTIPLLGMFLLLFTYESYRAWREVAVKTQEDQIPALQQFYRGAEKDFHKGHLDYAQEKLNVVLKQVHKGTLHTAAVTLSAKILNAQGHHRDAYELLNQVKPKLLPENQILFQQVAYKTNHCQEAIDIGKKVYQFKPSYEVALINALCHAVLGQVSPSIGWLNCALKNGLPNLKDALSKPEFDVLRDDPSFKSFAEKHT